MTAYETGKSLAFTELSLWESHFITIAFTSTLAAITTWILVDKVVRNRELEEKRKAAEKQSSAKTDFLSHMSHELRTPLNSILGFSQLLQFDSEELTADKKENLKYIVQSAEHMLAIINHAIEALGLETSNMDLVMEPIVLHNAVAECLDILQTLMNKHHIIIDASGMDCHFQVLADDYRLKQILLNLLSNAIKFNRPGGSVTVSSELVGDFIRLKVSDTGYGLTAEQQAHIFDSIRSLENGLSKVDGTGIGLILSKYLIGAMNGNIGCHTELGVGSTFWIEIPAHRPESSPFLAENGLNLISWHPSLGPTHPTKCNIKATLSA